MGIRSLIACGLVMLFLAGCSARHGARKESAGDAAATPPGQTAAAETAPAGVAISSTSAEKIAADAVEKPAGESDEAAGVEASAVPAPEPAPIPAFVTRGIEWLVEAQHESGGWGAGSHSNQQLRDPRKVQIDPATTAFTAMALIRAGHTPVSGRFRETVRRATDYLVRVVDESPPEGPRIAGPRGTQPQAKLGELVDTVMAVHFFSRVMATLPAESDLARRVDRALDKCLAKLEGSQLASGGWGGGTWAGVLQSALGCTALEFAQAAGKSVDVAFITSAREHQKANFDASSGRAHASDSAGVELYAASSSQRAAAGEARAAADLLDDAKRQGQLPPSAQVSEENLRQIGVAGARARLLAGSYAQNRAIIARLSDEAMLRGFGSNGGEEYLSYMLTSESMLMTGGEDWQQWSDLIRKRLETIQSADGSWTGHHCITSPVFCTAAVVQCLTTDRDAELLSKIREQPEEGSARP